MFSLEVVYAAYVAGVCTALIACLCVYGITLIAKDVLLEAKAKQDDEQVEELKRMKITELLVKKD